MDFDAGRLQLHFQPGVWALDPQVVDGIEAPALGRSTPGHGRQHPDDNGQALTDTLILASPGLHLGLRVCWLSSTHMARVNRTSVAAAIWSARAT